MANSITGINKMQVCDPLLYLVKNKHRQVPGKFIEENPVYSTTMTVRHTHTHLKHTFYHLLPSFGLSFLFSC